MAQEVHGNTQTFEESCDDCQIYNLIIVTNIKNRLCKYGELLASSVSTAFSNLLEQLHVVCNKPLKTVARSSFEGGRGNMVFKTLLVKFPTVATYFAGKMEGDK